MNNADAGTPAADPGSVTAHPLIRSYLDDLNRSMAGAEDRADVLTAVTEHIMQAAASLTGPPTTAQVRDILAGLGPVERIVAASGAESERAGTESPEHAPAVRPGPASPWLGTPSGIVALTALVLSIVVVPLFFPLAGLALVLAIIALIRRRPRPRSAWVVAITSGVLLAVVLAVGILASVFLFSTESGSGSPQPPASVTETGAP